VLDAPLGERCDLEVANLREARVKDAFAAFAQQHDDGDDRRQPHADCQRRAAQLAQSFCKRALDRAGIGHTSNLGQLVAQHQRDVAHARRARERIDQVLSTLAVAQAYLEDVLGDARTS